MPELPEVQTVVNQLAPIIRGKFFSRAKIKYPKMTSPGLSQKLRGQKIKDIYRRAKMIVIDLDSPEFLLIHLKMTGQLVFADKKGQATGGGHPINIKGLEVSRPNKFTHIILYFSDETYLMFHDVRRFGWMKLVNKEEYELISQKHGLEPLSKDFSLQAFKEILKKRPNLKIKQLLLSQDLIAGIGNIYADESLFLAGIRPDRQIKTLKPEEIKKLKQAIVSILKKAVKLGGTSFNTFVGATGQRGEFVEKLQVYQRAKRPCYKCGQLLEKTVIAGRGTVYCHKCQK